MLSRLVIKNFAIIDNLDIDFSSGLNIITGETGAGKSILIGALSLLLGQRADVKSLFKSSAKCLIEGTFDIAQYHLRDFFERSDLDYDNRTTLRREITAEGKTRAFVNDSPVNAAVLKELGNMLVDIHSQHETLEMNSEQFQVRVLDLVAGQEPASLTYQAALSEFNADVKRLKALTLENGALESQRDFFNFQLTELVQAKLHDESEQAYLEQELQSLVHAEEIKQALASAHHLISEVEGSITGKLKQTVQQLGGVEKFFHKAVPLLERLRSAYIELQDLGSELGSLAEGVVLNTTHLESVQNRLSELFALQQKHKVKSLGQLIELRDSFTRQLSDLEFSGDEATELTKKNELKRRSLTEMAKQLSGRRAAVIPAVETEIKKTLFELGMKDATVQIHQKVDTDKLTSFGIDQVQFLFSANKGFPLAVLSKVASGGELARLMLSVKSLTAAYTSMPTVIFDEIDTGVSGEVALKVGRVMEALSSSNQVIAITHLPQIASRGSAHFFVYKDLTSEKTSTHIRRLTDSERIDEIAKMLSGDNPGEFAMKNAKELLMR